MQVVKLPLLRFTNNMVFSNSLTYLILKWPKLCISFLNKPLSHILIAYLTRSLPVRCTRSKTKQNLYIPKFSTSRCQNAFKYQESKIWNSVTTDLKQQTFRKFKINCKKSTARKLPLRFASTCLFFYFCIVNYQLFLASNFELTCQILTNSRVAA